MIADKAGLQWRRAERRECSDRALLAFCAEYAQWAATNNRTTINELTNRSPWFRGYIPLSRRALTTARQMFWYLDELVLADPVQRVVDALPHGLATDVVHSGRQIIDMAKIDLLETIRVLADLRPALEAGQIVLVGAPRAEPSFDLHQAELIAHDVGVRQALDAAVVEQAGWKGVEGSYTLALDSFEITLAAGLQSKRLDLIRSLYWQEICHTIDSARVASTLDAASLFGREVDIATLRAADRHLAPSARQVEVAETPRLLLPFLEGVTSEHLAEIRQEAPEAFKAFRATLSEYVRTACQDQNEGTRERQERLRRLFEKDLVPLADAVARSNASLSSRPSRRG